MNGNLVFTTEDTEDTEVLYLFLFILCALCVLCGEINSPLCTKHNSFAFEPEIQGFLPDNRRNCRSLR